MAELHLLDDITVALVLAFAGGLLARLLRVSTILGFLAAGVVISPFTPGYVADVGGVRLLAEIGVILLMFGVGVHFDLADLSRVRTIAFPGAVLQIGFTTALAVGAGALAGLGAAEGVVLGFSTAIASTVVLMRTLQERGLLQTSDGHVVAGWSIVSDMLTVLILAVIPGLAGEDGQTSALLLAMLKAAAFVGVLLLAGARLVPALLGFVSRTGSRELFILAVVSIALAIAAGASAFGLSVALGAFVAGLVVGESEAGHSAAEEILPLRDAFAALFFVSVGMLLDPDVLADHLVLLLVALALVAANGAGAAAIVSAFPRWRRHWRVVAAGLVQIGEFSFIIADTALGADLLDAGTYNVILGASVVSITLNPLVFRALVPSRPRRAEPVPVSARA